MKDGKSSRVLVVDDDPLMLEFMCCVLGGEYEVLAADTCARALALMRDHGVPLAVLDYNLPDGDGLGLLSGLREINPSLRAMLVSGNLPLDEISKYSKEAPLPFLAKPVSVKALLDMVRVLESAAP